jgi:ParB family chromosome partitioning protein
VTETKRSRTAIDAKRGNIFFVDPNNLTIIGVDTNDGPEHPLYDERIKEPLSEETIKDFCIRGILENVLVRKNGDKLEGIAGRRRVLHAREANKRLQKEGAIAITVPTVTKNGTDAELLGIALAENAHRRDDSPTVSAQKLERYISMTNASEADAAIVFNVSVQTIKNWRAIHSLDPKVKRAIDNGTLKASAARDLAKLSREDQREELDKLAAEGGKITGKKVSAAAKAKKKGDEEVKSAQGKRLVLKVLKANEEVKTLPIEFVHAIEWMLGERSARSIPGLSGLIKEAQG